MFDRKAWRKKHYAEHREENLARVKKYYATHSEQRRSYSKKWAAEHPEQKKAKQAKWDATHRKRKAELWKKWRETHPEGRKEYQKRYRKTTRGKETNAISHAKYHAARKGLGFIPLNEYFEGAVKHHVDREHILYIPLEIHKSIPHSVRKNKNMNKINKRAFDYSSSRSDLPNIIRLEKKNGKTEVQ